MWCSAAISRASFVIEHLTIFSSEFYLYRSAVSMTCVKRSNEVNDWTIVEYCIIGPLMLNANDPSDALNSLKCGNCDDFRVYGAKIWNGFEFWRNCLRKRSRKRTLLMKTKFSISIANSPPSRLSRGRKWNWTNRRRVWIAKEKNVFELDRLHYC